VPGRDDPQDDLGHPARVCASALATLDDRHCPSLARSAEYLGAHPFFVGLDAASVQELAGCARNEHVRVGEYLFREGGTAEHFYVVMHGRIALELFSPGT
jgi:CRP-like cAMP-binding protein